MQLELFNETQDPTLKYRRLRDKLVNVGDTGKMQCFGESMMPIIESGSILTFQKEKSYGVGDIVFCEIQYENKRGFIDAHMIIDQRGDRENGFEFFIGPVNQDYPDNGWTDIIHGRVIKIEKNEQNIS
jgi:hypothetical protein